VREARFPFFLDQFGNPDPNNPNGGVEDLYTIVGRVDTPTSCTSATGTGIPQPGFASFQSLNDIIFRIPTPTFGTGLMENIDDATLLSNLHAQANNNVGVG